MNRNGLLFGALIVAMVLLAACGGATQEAPSGDDQSNGGNQLEGTAVAPVTNEPASLLPTPWVPTPQSGNADNFNDATISLVEYVKKYAPGAYTKIADYAGNTHISEFLQKGDYVSVHMEHNQAAWEPRVNDVMCFGSVFQYDPALHGDLILPANSTIIWWVTDKLDKLEQVMSGWIGLRESYEEWVCSG